MAAGTRIITSEDQVPPGFVSLAEIAEKRGEAARSRASYAHRFLGCPAVKLMRTVKDRRGPVWVNAEFFDALEAAELREPEPRREPEGVRVVMRPFTTDPGLILAQMLAMAERTQHLMERQAAALERIAGYCDGGKA